MVFERLFTLEDLAYIWFANCADIISGQRACGLTHMGITTMNCEFDKLLLLQGKKLDLDTRLEVLEYLDRCEICFEAIYLMTRDQDARFHVRYPLEEKLAS